MPRYKYDKDKFLQANFRFMVSGEGLSYGGSSGSRGDWGWGRGRGERRITHGGGVRKGRSMEESIKGKKLNLLRGECKEVASLEGGSCLWGRKKGVMKGGGVIPIA